MTTTTTQRDAPTRLRLLLLPALVLALAALLAGPAGAAANEQANSGWYTGLEHRDLPQQPAVENEGSNSGWYTGLEYQDLSQPQPVSVDGGFPWETTTYGLVAAVAALLLAATLVATRSRNGRVASNC